MGMLSGIGILFGIGIEMQPHSVIAIAASIRISRINARLALFRNFV